ncbi:MAG: hypothetical protein ABI333_13590 [bacterium]
MHRLLSASRSICRLGLMLAVAVLVSSASCKDEDEPLRDDFPNLEGGNPLVPEVALYPFPSDFYLEVDPTTHSGHRVSIPQVALPPAVPVDILNDADGFTMMPAILAYLPGGVALDSLPDPLEPGATLEDDSAVFLVNADTGERVPALAELDANTTEVTEQALIIRPNLKLDPVTGYVVILRDTLRTADGEAHVPNDAFLALRDGIPTADPAVERQRDAYELVNATIADQGLQPEEVVLAWSFHTRSEEQVVGPLVEMQQQAWEEPVGDYTIVDDATDTNGNRRIEMTFEAPSWRDADGMVQLDSAGIPILLGTETVEFRVTIPDTVDEPRPVMLYGHGFFGHYDQSSRGAANKLCRERRYSAVATNLGFNEEDESRIVSILSADLADIHWLVSVNWQKTTNFTSLAKLVRDRLSDELFTDIGAGPFLPLDGSRIFYSGISNGGTFGYVIASTSPAFDRAVLIVGGGGLTHFLQRAVQWNEFAPIFELMYPSPLELQLVLSVLQGPIDSIDSINYAHRLTRERFPDLPPMKAAVHMALNDSQVRNILTEWVARTARVPLAVPSAKDIWGLETISADPPDGAQGVDSALFVYDEHVEPSPITNQPPAEDNGTHQSVDESDVLQESWYQLAEFGRFVQPCSGACDPD